MPCWVVCRALSFPFPKQKVQQVGRTWEMTLVAFSLSLRAAAALTLVYLNPEEARSRDSGPGKLSSRDADVISVPRWTCLCGV